MKYSKNAGIFLEKGDFSNYVTIDNNDCEVVSLKKNARSPNGYVFELKGEDVRPQVIKFCSVYGQPNQPWLQQKQQRFEREIRALYMVKDKKATQHVIEIYTDDTLEIESNDTGEMLIFRYFTMEKGDLDLSVFLKKDTYLSERFFLCYDMIKSVQMLHSIDIYHRDIKPANFVFVDNVWKIADLGLADSRDEDFSCIDLDKEKIGPRGFLSPEAINKWLSISRKWVDKTGDQVIDAKSDVFQLAKVIGFVLLGDVLQGHLHKDDLKEVDDTGALYTILINALQYAKERRLDIGLLEQQFKSEFGARYALG